MRTTGVVDSLRRRGFSFSWHTMKSAKIGFFSVVLSRRVPVEWRDVVLSFHGVSFLSFFLSLLCSASGASVVAIDNKIEQAMVSSDHNLVTKRNIAHQNNKTTKQHTMLTCSHSSLANCVCVTSWAGFSSVRSLLLKLSTISQYH